MYGYHVNMNWECPYCHQFFYFEKHQQKGAHVINCKANPKQAEIAERARTKAIAALSVPKIELRSKCPICDTEIVQMLSQKEIDTGDFKIFCSRKCANSRKVAQSTRDKLSEGFLKLKEDPSFEKRRVDGISKSFEIKRLEYQKRGAERIKLGEPLYVAGCMLYWGEGSKGINSVAMTNSDPNMLVLVKKFLTTYWNLLDSEYVININCYTDLHTLEEIEEYWIKTLSLTRSNLRKSTVNNLPKSSKNSKANKSEYGTVRLSVHKTEIVQEIFGAIQEFGSFAKSTWISHKRGNKAV